MADNDEECVSVGERVSVEECINKECINEECVNKEECINDKDRVSVGECADIKECVNDEECIKIDIHMDDIGMNEGEIKKMGMYLTIKFFSMYFIEFIQELLAEVEFDDSDSDNEIKRNDNIIIDHKKSVKPEDFSCTICRSEDSVDIPESNNSIAELCCTHTFHRDCIIEWGKYVQSCPVCRKSLSYTLTDSPP